jgi:hypothetical protein
MKLVLTIIYLFTTLNATFSQTAYNVLRTDEIMKIDGRLDEEIWNKATKAENFTVNYPKFGEISRFKSTMYLIYDNTNLYVGANLEDPSPDSVLTVMSTRDDQGNADWAGILIDTYGQGLNGFAFAVTAAGVEIDALINDVNFNANWNAVWSSKVVQTKTGWAFEMKIPLAAIRFSKDSIQDWKINFVRNVRRERQQSYFFPVDPEKYGEIAQNQPTVGIQNIKSPLRLSISPYLSSYAINSVNSVTGKQEWGTRTTGGLDLKYGLSEAFTLDMSLIPDFGQTVSDQKVLNVGPFEVRYNENRSFFTEGTDLFSIGNVFYSRRIGGQPLNYEIANSSLNKGEKVINNPTIAPLLNAAKISGRTEKGLGIGLFNAIVGTTKATISDSLGNSRSVVTNPYTNYNVFVFSQNLKNNGTASILNTNVLREGSQPDANVSVADVTIYTPDLKYFGIATLKVSDIISDKHLFGHSVYLAGGKAIGKFQTETSYYEESNTYEINDFGFLQNNNSRVISNNVTLRYFKPKGMFLRKYFTLFNNFQMLYKPQLYSNNYNELSAGGTTRKFLSIGNSIGVSAAAIDFFESRTFGKSVYFPASFNYSAYFSSDYSKRFALDIDGNIGSNFDQSYHYSSYQINLRPRFRVSNNFFFVLGSNLEKTFNEYGYVRPYTDVGNQIIIGTRNRLNVTNTVNLFYTFTNRMSANVVFRHYWSQIDYNFFSSLDDEGHRAKTTYTGVGSNGEIHDISYNAFTIDMSYQWVFYPGARLSLAWKNNIFNYKNALETGYFGTFNSLFKQDQINSLSLRALFFIDAIWFKMKKGGR